LKTTFAYDHYYLYEELKANLEYFAQTYPSLCSLESIGTSREGRSVFALTITDSATGHPLSKPAFHIDGNTHAGEVTGSMAAMHTIDYLLTNSEDPKIQKILAKKTIYVIPRLSPDGAETYLSTPYMLRSVNAEYHEKDKGVYQEDLDNDGVIRMMRVKSPFGAWKAGDKHPLVLSKRKPDDTEGTFYNVYVEGLVENYDGLTLNNGKPLWGLDYNRNYPFGWFAEYRQAGAGKYPLSNPETKAVVDFVIAHPNIGAVCTHHTSGGVLLYPPGTFPSKKASQTDMKFYKEIGKLCTEATGYPVINLFDTFMKGDAETYSSGAFDDWCYHDQGILAYTLELWDLAARAGKPVDWSKRGDESIEEQLENFEAELKWISENAPECLSDWHEVDHPTLGKVEIGGVNDKYCSQNPPKNFLLQEMEKTTDFCLRYLKALPQLAFDKVEKTEIAPGAYKISAVIYNKGYLPTYISEEAKHIKVAKEVKACLEGDVVVLNGDKISKLGDLAGYGQIQSGIFFYGGITTRYVPEIAKEVSWVVAGKPGDTIKIAAFSPKAGKITQDIVL
jgi:hypothetical protein